MFVFQTLTNALAVLARMERHVLMESTDMHVLVRLGTLVHCVKLVGVPSRTLMCNVSYQVYCRLFEMLSLPIHPSAIASTFVRVFTQ